MARGGTMIDAARRRGFKTDAGDGEAKDAQHAKELKDAGERTPRPDTWFSLRRGLRGYASTRSASRPPTARRGRQTTMHDRNDTTSTAEPDSRSYASYVQGIPNVRSRIAGPRRESYASYASYAVCDGGVCARPRSPALARARCGRWGGRNRVRCVRSGSVSPPSCGYNLTPPRKMALDRLTPNVRFGGAA